MQELTLGLEELRLLAAIGNVRVGAEPSGPTAPMPGEGKSMRGRAAPHRSWTSLSHRVILHEMTGFPVPFNLLKSII